MPEHDFSFRHYLGLVIEAMRKVYEVTITTKSPEYIMSDMSAHTVNFIKENEGEWDYTGWEAFLRSFQKRDLDLRDEVKAYLVEVLDASRELYTLVSSVNKT